MSESLHQDEKRRNGLLRGAKRVVIKLGTSTVTGSQGELSLERIEPIVRAIATLQTNRRQVVLVFFRRRGTRPGMARTPPFSPERYGNQAGLRRRWSELVDGSL